MIWGGIRIASPRELLRRGGVSLVVILCGLGVGIGFAIRDSNWVMAGFCWILGAFTTLLLIQEIFSKKRSLNLLYRLGFWGIKQLGAQLIVSPYVVVTIPVPAFDPESQRGVKLMPYQMLICLN